MACSRLLAKQLFVTVQKIMIRTIRYQNVFLPGDIDHQATVNKQRDCLSNVTLDDCGPCVNSLVTSKRKCCGIVSNGGQIQMQFQCMQLMFGPGVWGAMEPKTNVSSESHRKGAFRSPAHPPGITL